MAFIGRKPTPSALTSSDISADIIDATKIADDAISEEHLDPTIITGLTALGGAPADTDEFLVSDAGVLKRMDYSHIKASGGNTPIIYVMKDGNQSVSDDTWTKITWATEKIDTDNTFASDKFTPAVAGKYFISATVNGRSDTQWRIIEVQAGIYKNGSSIITNHENFSNNAYEYNKATDVFGVVDLDDDDYIEIYGKVNVSANNALIEGSATHGSSFIAFKIG